MRMELSSPDLISGVRSTDLDSIWFFFLLGYEQSDLFRKLEEEPDTPAEWVSMRVNPRNTPAQKGAKGPKGTTYHSFRLFFSRRTQELRPVDARFFQEMRGTPVRPDATATEDATARTAHPASPVCKEPLEIKVFVVWSNSQRCKSTENISRCYWNAGIEGVDRSSRTSRSNWSGWYPRWRRSQRKRRT